MDTLDDVMLLDEATRRALAEMQAAFEQQAAADYESQFGGRSTDATREQFINDSIDRQRNTVRSASALMQSNAFNPGLSGGLPSAAPMPDTATGSGPDPAQLLPLADPAGNDNDNDAMRALAFLLGMGGAGAAAYGMSRLGRNSGVSGTSGRPTMSGALPPGSTTRGALPSGSMGALGPGPRVNTVGSPAALPPGPAAGGYRFNVPQSSLPPGTTSPYMRFNVPQSSLPAGPTSPYIARVNVPRSSLPGYGPTSAFPRLSGIVGNASGGGFSFFGRAGGGGRLYGR